MHGKSCGEKVAALRRLDFLVSNDGIFRQSRFLEFSEKDWYDVMNLT